MTNVSDATTTMEETSVTGVTVNINVTSLSPGTKIYFRLAVVVIGVIGTAANGLILYALVASKQHKSHVLIVNQNALDLFGCIFLVISYAVKLSDIHLSGWIGYWLCMLIVNDNIVWCGIIGSVINLAIITVERYLKVAHYAWSKAKLHNSMIYSAMAFAWIYSVVYNSVFSFSASFMVNGVCYPAIIENESLKNFHLLYNFVSFYVIILLIFIFCYWRILLVVRRQAKIMSNHAAARSNTSQTHKQIQTNVIKTMILVCGFYAVMWLPIQITQFIWALSENLIISMNSHYSIYYASMFLAFMYTCTNPFIYATKFDPVKQVLLRMMPCKKTTNQASIQLTMVV